MRTNSITYPNETAFTTPRKEDLRPGDEVLIWDNISTAYEWCVIGDIVERGGRWKIRVIGSADYFDSGIVKSYRCAHYVPPARYRKSSKDEEEPHQDYQLRQDLYEREYPFSWA